MPTGLSNAISGLANFQRMIDVVGNNIANLYTPGYKASNVTFKELLSQTLKGASASSTETGGTNPIQVGLGTTLAAIESTTSQGPVEITGKITDMAITGSGFFILKSGDALRYARNGNFTIDGEGDIVNADGMTAQGWIADMDGAIDSSGGTATMRNINIPLGQAVTAKATTKAVFNGNLDSSTAVAGTHATKITTYDAMGSATEVSFTFTKIDATSPSWPAGAAAAWTYTAKVGALAVGNGVLGYNNIGNYDSTKSTIGNITYTPTDGSANVVFTPDFTTSTQLDTDFSSLVGKSQNGARAGSLETFTIDTNGVITGNFTNGLTQALGQVALGSFTNPAGLNKVEGGLFIESANSGNAHVGPANTGPRGSITASALEQSNVDLGNEFTRMIVAQRAFQANSRIVTTYDEILNEVANLRR